MIIIRQLWELILKPDMMRSVLIAYCLFLFGRSPHTVFQKKGFDRDRSFIRFGDGEILAYIGLSFHYQIADKGLTSLMCDLVDRFRNGSAQYDIGLPFLYIEKKQSYTFPIRAWIIARYMMPQIFPIDYEYGDAFYFRNIKDILSVQELYRGYQLHIVSNEILIDKILISEFKSSMSGYTIVQKENAFGNLDVTLTHIIEHVTDKVNTRILVSAGPTAKAIVYKLSELGYIAHDTGALFDQIL